jgi:hypothetical protein
LTGISIEGTAILFATESVDIVKRCT